MCGIFGFCGFEKAEEKLLCGLSSLEYRGYDSSGVSLFCGEKIVTIKSKGKLLNLKEKLKAYPETKSSTCGIGHTRWATHGAPSDINSHPHGTENLMLVHNGIIENYHEIKAFLKEKGYTFETETDTEAAAKLIDYHYKILKSPEDAIKKACETFSGAFAFGVIFSNFKEKIYAVRKGSPLLVCPSDVGNYITSDISAVLKYSKKFYRLKEGELAVIDNKDISIFSFDGEKIEAEFEEAQWDTEDAEKGGFPHFMIKEIFEEPDAIRKTLSQRIKNGLPFFEDKVLREKLKAIKNIHIIACGTALNSGLIGKYAIEKLAKIPVSTHIASEFKYSDPIVKKGDLVIAISQSGETADTLAALRLAKEKCAFTLGIVNVLGSSISREADSVLYTQAGPEIAVASTKAYSVQVSLLYLFAISLALENKKITPKDAKLLCSELSDVLPKAISEALNLSALCSQVAAKYKESSSAFFLGRGVDYYLSCEAALKVKEVSYIHCEAYAAGEMKHGTISLIEDGVPVFVFATQNELFEKTISNVKEVKARGAKAILIVMDNKNINDTFFDDLIVVPKVTDIFSPLVSCVVAQFIAYFTACHLGRDVDKPRNLAKSVTVE